jgi:hypothetical protein
MNVGIHQANNTAINGDPAFCYNSGEMDEREGRHVNCPHLGPAPLDSFSVRREAGNLLRFIWGDETWTSEDEKCKLVEDWHAWEHNDEVCVVGFGDNFDLS